MIFCDKTGTLTANHMSLRKFQINGLKFGDCDIPRPISNSRLPGDCLTEIHNTLKLEAEDFLQSGVKGSVTQFFEILALCNTVSVEKERYKSTSPDEIALVEGAREAAGIEMVYKDSVKGEVRICNRVTKT